MSTVKISALPAITQLNSNTANTLLVGVDIPTGITGKITATTLAQGLYANNVLNVGNNSVILPNTIAQFASSSNNYVQVNFVNTNDGGTADYIITANTGTDTTNFIDLGLANKNITYGSEFNSLGTSMYPLDGYLYVQGNTGQPGGNLIVGTATTGTRINFIAGGSANTNIVGYIDATGAKFPSIDNEISSNVSLLNSYLVSNIAAVNYSVSSNVITLNTSISTNVATINSSIDANLILAKAYTDSVNANNTLYTTTIVSSNLATAKAYTDTANSYLQLLTATEVAANLATAKAYTDTANSYIVGLLEGEVAANLATAKAYTDTANSYLQLLTSTGLAANLATAKAYTDTANTYLQTQINTINSINAYQNNYSTYAYSHANSAYTQANNGSSFANSAYTLANTNASAISTANTFLQSNDAITLSVSKSYTDTANGYLKSYTDTSNTNLKLYTDAQITANLNTAKSYTDTANTYIQNNYLANTSGTFGGNLTIAGKANVNQQLVIANSTYDYTNTTLVSIVGSTGAFYQPPANPGYMLSITGVDGVSSRVINSSYGTGAYALFAGRKGNGTAGSPTAVLNNDVIARFSGSGYNGSTFTPTGQGRIDIVADENFTTANNGSRIEFYNTMAGSNTVTKIATFNANVATFSGVVNAQKGFIFTPNVISTTINTLNIDVSNSSFIKCNTATALSISLSNLQTGKVVELWVTNVSGSTQTITHGAAAINSTINNTQFSMPATSSAHLRYFCIAGDMANTYVSISHS